MVIYSILQYTVFIYNSSKISSLSHYVKIGIDMYNTSNGISEPLPNSQIIIIIIIITDIYVEYIMYIIII